MNYLIKMRKISKSKGNGLSIEEWLSYGTEESLTLYMYQNQTKKDYILILYQRMLMNIHVFYH